MAQFNGRQTQYLPFGGITLFTPPKQELCGLNQDFCQLTEQTDRIKFQFLAAETVDLVADGDFPAGSLDPTCGVQSWCGSNWVINTGAAEHIVETGTGPGSILTQQSIFTLNNFFRVNVTVTDRTAGNVTVNGFPLTISSNGTFTVYTIWVIADLDLKFLPSKDFDGRVTDVSVVEVARESDYDIDIFDNETGIKLADVPAGAIVGATFNNVITVDFNWLEDIGISNGCVDIRLFLASSLFEDDFTINQGWGLVGGVTISAGATPNVMAFLFNVLNFANGATFLNLLEVGSQYTVTYDVLNYISGSVNINVGSTAGLTRTSNGTFTETLICTNITSFAFVFNQIAGVGNLQVDNVIIGKANDFDGQSECFDLQTSHDCTLLYIWSNNQSWGDFDYSAGFNHQMRVTSRFRGPGYPSVRNIGEDSAGVKSMDYTSLRKEKILDVDFNPEFIHDGIAAMFMQDNRSINGTSFLLVDEYEPSTPNDSKNQHKDLMTSRSELEPTIQANLINRNV